MDINTELSCSRTIDPDMTFGLDFTMAPVAVKVTKIIPGCSMTLRHPHSLKEWSRPRIFAQPLVVTGATDINCDPDFCRATDPDIAHDSNSDRNVISAQGGNTGHLISMAPVVTWHLDTNIATGGSSYPRYVCDL